MSDSPLFDCVFLGWLIEQRLYADTRLSVGATVVSSGDFGYILTCESVPYRVKEQDSRADREAYLKRLYIDFVPLLLPTQHKQRHSGY